MQASSGSRRGEPLSQQSAAATALEEYLELLAPHLHPDLVSSRARGYLRRLAHALPATDVAGFECSLGAGEAPVDLIMRLPRGGLELDGPLCQDPVWRSVADLDRRLQDASSVLRDVNVIHLEFDLMAAPPAVPVPGIFFELSREALQPPGRLLELAGQLCGGSLPGAVLGSLRRAVEALPARGRVIHLGAMRSRPGHGLRIVVGRVQSGLLFDYLTQAGWSGDRRTVEDGITALGGLFDTMLVSMDLGGTVRPRLGFECYIDPKPERFEQWRALLGRAVELGLCAPAKAPALLAWHGVCRQPEHLQSWPRHLRWGDRLLQDRATSVVARFLSHVKVVLRPDRPLELKGYYGFAHYWLEPSDPRGESSTRSWRIP